MKQFFAIAATLLLGASFATSLAVAQETADKDALQPETNPVYHYSFTEVNFKGDTFTQLLGINSSNVIAGYHGSGLDADHPNKGFTYTKAGGFVSENYPGSAQTQVIGINDAGNTSGFWVSTKGHTYGFTEIKGSFHDIYYPGTTFNQLLGLNNSNVGTGYSQDAAGNFHPYSVSVSPVWTSFLLPGTMSAQATGTSNTGAVVGFFIDGNGVNHGFQFLNGLFHTLDFPGSTSTQVLGTNDANWMVGTYTDASGNTHGFLNVAGHFTSIDDPNGVGTTIINGINNAGTIVGFWGNTAAGISHGFYATVTVN